MRLLGCGQLFSETCSVATASSRDGTYAYGDPRLSALSEPLSLNRYLYCEADPVNYADPTGYARVVAYKPKGRAKKSSFPGFDSAAKPGQASLDPVWRDFNMLSGALQMHTTAYGARKAAYGNTVRLNGEKADLIERKYGWGARQAFSAQVARNFKVHVERYYCGSNEHLRETAATLHSFAQDYWYLPVAGTLADWCGYVAEGDVEMTALYSVLGLVDVLGVGSIGSLKTGLVQAIKSGGKLAMGSGVKTVTKLYKPVDNVSENTLHHIFDNPGHNLDALLKKYGGDKEMAYRAIEDKTITYASINSEFYSSPNAVAHINVDGIELESRYAIVDGTLRIPTAYIPEGI